ncbi:MAG: glucosamine-6-phosphate deaminase [Abditibacteriota bacterium]|nr:glucosamine-6-phosphate deaminase [Abditibacteriota bacterium]
MEIVISQTKAKLGQQSAQQAAKAIRGALQSDGEANIVVATGASQFDTLAALVAMPDIDWSQVTAFHLDEYVGLPITHEASFRKYLRERFTSKLSQPLRAFHEINGEDDAHAECERLNALIAGKSIAVALVGIGENGHLAFNDPPADFQTTQPYIVVQLDETCRRQQLGEGWFPSLEDVPQHAISMSIHQIMQSREIVCSVPDERKAQAVQGSLEGPVTPQVPASILQQHPATTIYLDPASASLLSQSY